MKQILLGLVAVLAFGAASAQTAPATEAKPQEQATSAKPAKVEKKKGSVPSSTVMAVGAGVAVVAGLAAGGNGGDDKPAEKPPTKPSSP